MSEEKQKMKIHWDILTKIDYSWQNEQKLIFHPYLQENENLNTLGKHTRYIFGIYTAISERSGIPPPTLAGLCFSFIIPLPIPYILGIDTVFKSRLSWAYQINFVEVQLCWGVFFIVFYKGKNSNTPYY